MTGSSPPSRSHLGPRRLQWGLSKQEHRSPTPDRSGHIEESPQSSSLAASTSEVPNVEDVRRQVLREVLEAIAVQSTHELDKGIGYRLDVQAVATCAEELSARAREDALCNVEERIAKKVKVARERATREAEERGARNLACQKQKFEKDIKRLKLEVEKQNKKRGEIEREKRQAFCEAAQHSRNLKALSQDLEKSKREEESAKKALEKQNRLARRAEDRLNQSEENCQAELRTAKETICGLEAQIVEMDRGFKAERESQKMDLERDMAAFRTEANAQRDSDVAEAMEQERQRSLTTIETARRQNGQLMAILEDLKEENKDLWELCAAETIGREKEICLEGSHELIEEAREVCSQMEAIINLSNEYKTRLRWIDEKVAGFGIQSLEDLFTELEEMRVRVAKLDLERSNLEGQLQTEKSRCGEISADAGKLISQNEALSRRVRDLESSIPTLAEESACALEQLKEKKEETLLSKQKIMELEECLETAEKEVSTLKGSIADKKKEIEGLQTSFQQATTALKLKEDNIPGIIARHTRSCEASFCKAVQGLCDRYFPNKIPANDSLSCTEAFKYNEERDVPVATNKRPPLKAGRRPTGVLKDKGFHKQVGCAKNTSCTENVCASTRSHKELMDAVDNFNMRRREGYSCAQNSLPKSQESSEVKELLKLEFWILRTLVDTSLLRREYDEVARALKNAVSKVSAAQEGSVEQEGERGLAFRLVRALTSEKRDLNKRLKRTEQQLKSLSTPTSRHSAVHNDSQPRGAAVDSPQEMVAEDCIIQDMREVVAVMEVLHGQSPPTKDIPE